MPEGKKKEVAIRVSQETALPRFSNLIASVISKERDEVIIDFLFVDERILDKEGKLVGHPIAKIAMTFNTAKELRKVLEKLPEK